MKLDLSARICTLDGNPTQHTFAGLMANELVNTPNGPAEKFYDWAVELHRTGQLTIADGPDLNLLRDWVRNSQTITILAKVPLIRLIDRQVLTEAISKDETDFDPRPRVSESPLSC